MEYLGLRPNGLLESLQQIGLRRGAWKIDARDFDLVAPRALVPSRQHAGVVLFGRDNFIARLQVDAHLGDLKRFASIAGDRDLFRVGAKFGSEPSPRRFNILLNKCSVIRGRLVGPIHVSLARLVYDRRRRTLIAVIEVDERAIQRESELDFA